MKPLSWWPSDKDAVVLVALRLGLYPQSIETFLNRSEASVMESLVRLERAKLALSPMRFGERWKLSRDGQKLADPLLRIMQDRSEISAMTKRLGQREERRRSHV